MLYPNPATKTRSVERAALYVSHSETEDRFKSIGPIRRRLVLVVWIERADDLVRIISAWWATKTEEKLYAEYVESLR
jgi:uncharacterized DUF497 family protein